MRMKGWVVCVYCKVWLSRVISRPIYCMPKAEWRYILTRKKELSISCFRVQVLDSYIWIIKCSHRDVTTWWKKMRHGSIKKDEILRCRSLHMWSVELSSRPLRKYVVASYEVKLLVFLFVSLNGWSRFPTLAGALPPPTTLTNYWLRSRFSVLSIADWTLGKC